MFIPIAMEPVKMNECWCGMDHSKMELDDEGWFEFDEESES